MAQTVRQKLVTFDLATLDRKGARLALAVDRFVRGDLGVDWRGASLLVAYSGGADSTALLALLAALRSRLRLTLTAAHLDHGLRPESGEDALCARDMCERLGISFVAGRADVAGLASASGMGLEEAGRAARYDFLRRARAEAGADFIVTAHQAGDLAEDVLLRLVRGAAWPALGGMRGVTEDGLLRPLLLTDKDDLLDFLRRHGLPWREDASNSGRAFRRNRIRHDVLPLLKAENPALADVFRHIWRNARLDEAYWAGRRIAREENGTVLLAHEDLAALHPAARLRAYADAARSLGAFPRSSTLFALEEAFCARRHNKRFQFPGLVRAELSARGVLFARTTAKTGEPA